MTKSVYLKAGKEGRVLSGHPWIFSSDLDWAGKGVFPGDVVNVLSNIGKHLGQAVYNPKSQITLRMLAYDDTPIDSAFIKNRVREAVALRRQISDLNCCRLINAESDRLPAVIADSFGGVISLQCLSLGMARYQDAIVEALVEELSPGGIWERNDVPVRALEGMEQSTGLLYGEVPEQVEISENGLRMLVDVRKGQKTGYFLDQKENRAALAPLVPGMRVLDCFSHTGSFALHAAHYGAASVSGVDISDHAVACANRNAALNGYQDRVDFVEANAFDYLRASSDSKDMFDVVVLDPPAFTKSRQAVEGAVRGYKEINLRALKIVKPGGFLVSCSCSHHVSQDLFLKTIHEAATDAHRQVRLVEYRSQAKDHPILLASAETQYIKCAILQVY